MLNPKTIVLAIAFALAPFSARAYDCYDDFRKIGETRLSSVRALGAKVMASIKALQEAKKIDFESALAEYKKFTGNSETKSIDARIEKIDARSAELNPQIKAETGEAQCLERMKLEQERARLADRKVEAINRALIEN